jgi:hypothetical protein
MVERWMKVKVGVVANPLANQPQVEGKLVCTTFRHPTPYTRPRLSTLAKAVKEEKFVGDLYKPAPN